MSTILSTSQYVSRLKDLLRANLPALFFGNSAFTGERIPLTIRVNQFTREMAVEVLIEKGHTNREAELIANTIEEWGLDFDQAAYMKFEVHGESVWMNPE